MPQEEIDIFHEDLFDERINKWHWLPYVIFAVITAILAIPVLKNIHNWGWYDWDLFTTLNAASVKSLADYGQFPLWNPYFGSGGILFAHPEVAVLNPLFALSLIFGPLVGLKVQILIIYYLGFTGWFLLARRLKISLYGSFLPPVVFMLSSFFALQIAAGHVWVHYFCALPWLIYFYRRSLKNNWHLLSGGGVIAFIILGSGAAVPFLMSILILFIFSLFDIKKDELFRPPLYVMGIILCGMIFAAVKFLPMLDYMLRNPWIPEMTAQVTPSGLLIKMYFALNHAITADYVRGYQGIHNVVWGWHEYGAYIGPIVLALVIAALSFRFREDWPYLVMGVIALLLVLGSFSAFSPWEILHRFPGYESMRVPSRFSVMLLFAVAILAGRGLDVLVAMFKHRRTVFALVIFLAVLGTHLFISYPILNRTFIREPKTPPHHDNFRQSLSGNYNARQGEEKAADLMYYSLLSNRGTLNAAWLSAYPDMSKTKVGSFYQTLTPESEDWYDVNEKPRAKNRDYNRKRIVFKPWYALGDSITITKAKFTPNRIRVDFKAKSEGRIIFTQFYDPGWRTADGNETESQYDLVSLPAKDKHVEVVYRPRYLYLGMVLSILSIIGAVAAPIINRMLR